MPTKNVTSNTFIATNASTLLPKCVEAFINNLCVCVEDQLIVPVESGSLTYSTGNTNFCEDPTVYRIDPSNGAQVLLFLGTDYTVNHAAGEITLTATTSDPIHITYSYHPFSDEQIETMFYLSVSEVAVLSRRKIDPESIMVEYETAICLQLTINLMKALMLETRDFFAVSVAGKNVSLADIPKTFDLIIKQYNDELMLLIRQLRQWNTSDRLE